MKKILKFNGQLIDVMGETDAHANWKTELGLIVQSGHQHTEDEEYFTLMEVVDERLCQKYLDNFPGVEVLTVAEANTVITTKFKPKHSIYNDTIMGVNLTEKLSKQKEAEEKLEVIVNEVKLDEMLPEWTIEQEAEYLYNKGISGIKKKDIPKGFTEE